MLNFFVDNQPGKKKSIKWLPIFIITIVFGIISAIISYAF